MKKITIGIATRIVTPIRLQYLHDCIDSVIHQDNKNWELVISDDNSTIDVDWERYAEYPNIKIYHQSTPLGIFGNFNFCLQNTATDLFFPLSDDDLLEDGFVDTVLNYFNNDTHDTDVLCFNYSCIRSNGEIYIQSDIHDGFIQKGVVSMNVEVEKMYSRVIPKMYIHSIVRTKSIKEIGGYPDHGMITDGLLNYLFPLTFNIGFLEEYLVRIRHHENNRGGVDNIDLLREEKIRLSDYIEKSYVDMLTPENKKRFFAEKSMLTRDHVYLLMSFKKYGRIRGVHSFLAHPITFRNIFILSFGIIFGRKIHKYFIFFTKYYTEASYKILSFFKH